MEDKGKGGRQKTDAVSSAENLFRTQSVWKSIASLAVPAVVIILVMIIYNMTDLFFIGRLGDTAKVAAISLASPVFSLVSAVATMIGGGGSVLAANALGNHETDQARRIASLCFWAAVIFGVILCAAILLGADLILPFLGATEETWNDTKAYLTVCAFGEPFMLATMAMGSVIRSEGAIKEGVIGNLGANIVNIVLDPVFIFGFGWGVAGAAAATVLANVFGTCWYLYYAYHREGAILNMNPALALQEVGTLPGLLFLGLPTALSTLLTGLASTFSNRILASYSTDAVAAMAAAGKTTMVIGMLQIGMCNGVQPLMAYNYGAKDTVRLKEILRKMVILTVTVGTISGLFCLAARGPIIGLFLTEETAASLGETMIPYLVIASPVIGLFYLATNFIQASGHAAPATLLSLLRQGIFLIPLLYLMSALLGLNGIAAAHMVADVLSSAVGVVLLIRHVRKLDRSGREQFPERKPTSKASEG